MFSLIFVTLLLGIIVRYLNKSKKPAILGIYQQNNTFFYIKCLMMYLTLKIRQVSTKFQNRNENKKRKNHDLECPKMLYNNHLAIDSVYFNGISKNGAALICGLARRPDQICNAFLYLRTEGGELLLSPELPNSTVKQLPDEENFFHVSGIKIDMIKPMKTWRIQYEGSMKLFNDLTKTVSVKLDANFESEWNHFNYDTDMSSQGMARDIARELWSREYFEILQRVHQNHYEQFGQIKGKVVINDIKHDICLDTLRDRTNGKRRDWKDFHRYALHFITLANGDHIAVGKICMPICFSDLTTGFVCTKNSKAIYPVSYCDFKLYQHGENFNPPKDYAFQFHAGGIKYVIEVNVTDSAEFYLGKENECLIIERIAKFTVNGVEGWGASEFQYRNVGRENNS